MNELADICECTHMLDDHGSDKMGGRRKCNIKDCPCLDFMSADEVPDEDMA